MTALRAPLAAVLLALALAGEARADDAAAAGLVPGVKTELGEDFRVEVRAEHFVLASNASDALTARAAGTIERMFSSLYKEFFTRRPTRPLRVYCFADAPSYEAYVRKTYGREPSTPFGFYSSRDRRLVMNIGTGTGTLAHEVVHPLIAEDFPAVPSWFNEGFASLFEQSAPSPDGGMRGLTNWRLKGLQAALRDPAPPRLAALIATSSDEFYGDDSGRNYALARYLCYFLQEHGALQAFYAEFRQTARQDPTGRRALERVLGVPLDAIEEALFRFVRRLTFKG